MCTSLASTSVFGNARSRAQPRLRGLRDLRTVPGQGTGAPRPRSLGWGSSPDPPFPPPNLMFSRGFNTSWDSTAPTAGFRLNVCPETQSPRRGTFHLKEMQNGGGEPCPLCKAPRDREPSGSPSSPQRSARDNTEDAKRTRTCTRVQTQHAHTHKTRGPRSPFPKAGGKGAEAPATPTGTGGKEGPRRPPLPPGGEPLAQIRRSKGQC